VKEYFTSMSGNMAKKVGDCRLPEWKQEPIPKKKWERVEPAPVRKTRKFYEV